MTNAPESPTARRPIEAGDRLVCDGWTFGGKTFDGYRCVAVKAESVVADELQVLARDKIGMTHLYPVARFRHAD